MNDQVWLWNVNLAWELFSSSIYNYRESIREQKEHKRHAYFKNTILNAVTAVEVFMNEFLKKNEGWSNNRIKGTSIADKITELGIDPNNTEFKDAKEIRNKFIVHHMRIDQKYFLKISPTSALDAIESSQDIIAGITFNKNKIFPYWITGLNFINPIQGNDITLMNDFEFWRRLKMLKINTIINDMVDTSGDINPPSDQGIYNSLYKELWKKIIECNFNLDILNTLKSEKFPSMPILTSEWWDDNED